jgi:hypothetical protein
MQLLETQETRWTGYFLSIMLVSLLISLGHSTVTLVRNQVHLRTKLLILFFKAHLTLERQQQLQNQTLKVSRLVWSLRSPTEPLLLA